MMSNAGFATTHSRLKQELELGHGPGQHVQSGLYAPGMRSLSAPRQAVPAALPSAGRLGFLGVTSPPLRFCDPDFCTSLCVLVASGNVNFVGTCADT